MKRNFSEISICNSEITQSIRTSEIPVKKQKSYRTSNDSALFSTDNDVCRLQSSSEDDYVDVESLTDKTPKFHQKPQQNHLNGHQKTVSTTTGGSKINHRLSDFYV